MRGAKSRPLEIGRLSDRAGCLQRLALVEVCPPACRTAPLQSFSTRISAVAFSLRHTLPKRVPVRSNSQPTSSELLLLSLETVDWHGQFRPRSGRPRTFPDIHPSTQKYFDRLANRKKSYSLRCSVEGDQTSIAGPDDGLVSDFDPIDILRLESLALEDRNSPIELPRKSQTSTTCRQCDSANIVRYLALSLLLKGPLKASGAAQPQEASPGASETSKVIHTTSTDEGKILGETSDPKRSPVEAHQTSPAASRTETQPDPLPADDEDIETISSAAQAEIPKLPNDQGQHRPGQYETESNRTNTGQRRQDSTKAPRIRDG